MGLLGQPSATGQMLSLLMQQPPAGQPGQPAPAPAAPMPPPEVHDAPMPQAPQNLLGKIHDYISTAVHGAGHALQGVGGLLNNELGGGVPPEYQGIDDSKGGPPLSLLSPGDIGRSQPSWMQRIVEGPGAYRRNLNSVLRMHEIASATKEQDRIMQSRADMPADLTLPQQLQYAGQHHDIEMIQKLGEPLARMLGQNPNAETDRTPRTFTVNGQPVEGFSDKQGKFYTADGTPIPPGAKVTPYVAPQHDQIQLMPGVTPPGPNGEPGTPTVFRINKNGGPAVPVDGIAPKGGAGGSSQGAQVPVADMQERYDEIAKHAADLAAGKWKITPAMQMREGLTFGIARANAAGEHPPVSQQVGASAMDLLHLGQGPDYQRYQALMNSTRALGDDVAKVFKGRQNEQAVYREVALAQLTPDDFNNPKVVSQKLSRLRNVINLAKISNPAQAGLIAGAGGTTPAAPSGGKIMKIGKKTFHIPD
jgi:hypothetical protein